MRGAQTAQPFEIYYAIILRAQFRPAHSTEDGPLKELYFKVLPTGSSSLTAVVLGFPVLDVQPFGLEHQTCSQAHYFHALKVAVPRLELPARAAYRAALATYEENDGAYRANKADAANIMAEIEQIGSLTACQQSALHQAALDMKQTPKAYVKGSAALLEPR